MQTKLLENGMGKILTETWWQSWKSLSAWKYAITSPYQRLVK
uniref:Alternative protein USP53 n=1 Tax=Homo sapiens TaxID=9606 RepID=L8E8X6_HUMAN|nr:alternative protein USP53 [Homo sapiens]